MATWAGLIEIGNIDLLHRPIVTNSDGSISTVLSITVESDGIYVLIPTVLPNPARIVSNGDAVRHYLTSGEHLGKFDTAAHAEAYAAALHVQQAGYYANPQPAHAPLYVISRLSGSGTAPVIVWSQATDTLYSPAFGAHEPGDIFFLMIGTYSMSATVQPVWSVISDPANVYKPLGSTLVPKPQFNLVASYWDNRSRTFADGGNTTPLSAALLWARADFSYPDLRITPTINGIPYVAQMWSSAYIIRDTDPIDPIDAAIVSPMATTTSTNNITIPGITTTTSNDLVLIGANGVRKTFGTGNVGVISITPSLTQDYAFRTINEATDRNLTGIHGTFPVGSTGNYNAITDVSTGINWMSWMAAIRPDRSLYPEEPPPDDNSGGSGAHGNRHQSIPLGIFGSSLVKRKPRSGPN